MRGEREACYFSLFSKRVCFLTENLDLQLEGFGCVETDGKRRRICGL